MIQRIQTLYLLGIVALMIAALFTPLAYFVAGTEVYELFAFSLRPEGAVEAGQSTMYMGIIVALATLLPLVTIFLYKNRMLQIRLCAVELVLLAGAEIFMAIYYYLSNRMFSMMEFHTQGFRIAIIFPIVALILDYLALRAIFKDEMLVRSLDRIR